MTDDQLFATPSELKHIVKRYGGKYNGRYHMPRLPGDIPKKGHVKHEPGGMMRTTNLCGALVDTRALSIWEMEQALIGLALSPSLYEELTLLVHQSRMNGVDFSRLRDFPEMRLPLSGTPKDQDSCIVGRAKQAAGANEARQAGTNRHTAWEARAASGELIGTRAIRDQILSVEQLLKDAHLERVPGLSERIIRNEVVKCAGQFDDVLRDTRTGEMFMSDYKSKKRKFYTWMEVDAQLAIYANAEWILYIDEHGAACYTPGPKGRVNMEKGVVLHVPSDGGKPYLRKADLVTGWETAQLARRVVELRSYGTSAERERLSVWEN